MLAKTSYIANCFYSAARVRRSHRQGRAGCYPVMLMGTTSQQDVAPCTVTVGCFRRLASCYLHVRTVVVVVFTFCLSASCSCDHHVFSQPVCLSVCVFSSFVIFGQLHAIFMFAWSIFIQFLCFNVSCCICDGIHADVAETVYFV